MTGKTLLLASGCTGWITKCTPQTIPNSVVVAAQYFRMKMAIVAPAPNVMKTFPSEASRLGAGRGGGEEGRRDSPSGWVGIA